MGLRIIGRDQRRTTDLTETERMSQLRQEADHWLNVRGNTDAGVGARDRLIANYKSARERVGTPEEIEEMARRIRVGIMLDTTANNTPHMRVDIATLLELL